MGRRGDKGAEVGGGLFASQGDAFETLELCGGLFHARPSLVGQRVADQMHDAGLDRGLREHRGDRVGEAGEPVDHGDQDVADAAGLELVHHLESELGALGLVDPQADHLLFALAGGVAREMGVVRCSLYFGMDEQFADHKESFAERKGSGREGGS